jgi:hypothetical protein
VEGFENEHMHLNKIRVVKEVAQVSLSPEAFEKN